jgi:hypothetical protein
MLFSEFQEDSMNQAASETMSEKKRTRSPAYPYVNLETAINRAKQFYDKEGRNAANIHVAAKHWGMVEGSSAGLQTVAALISFGLMQDEGSGVKRTVRLTQPALKILLDTRGAESSDRELLIKKAALTPKIHNQIWTRWKGELPSDASLRHVLLFEWETPFNENYVDSFIGEFKSTIRFAKLDVSDMLIPEDAKADEKPSVKVGDYVQWVSQGMDQFKVLKKVGSFSDDGAFAFFEGENTGAPVEELEIGEAPAPSCKPVHPALRLTRAQMQPPGGSEVRQDVFSLDNGGEVTISWPVPLTADMITDIKDWLKIVERKIARSTIKPEDNKEAAE